MIIIYAIGALLFVGLLPYLMKYFVPLLAIVLIGLFIFGTGGLGGAILVVMLIVLACVNKIKNGG